MVDKFLVIRCLVGKKILPEATQHTHTSKSKVAHCSDVVGTDATAGNNTLVDKTGTRCIAQFVVGERRLMVGVAYAVTHGREEYIVELVALLLEFLERVAGSATQATECGWQWFAVGRDMNTAQVEFLLKIKMFVHHDAVAAVLVEQGKQTLSKDRLGAWFPYVQHVESLVEESGQDFILLYEKFPTSEQE